MTPEERIDAALAELRGAARDLASAPRRLLDGLNQNLRRLRTFESESQWSAIILDACAPFSARAAVFSLNVDALKLQGARGVNGADLGAAALDAEIPLVDARAFREAVDTAEPVTALRTAGEMSAPLAALFGEDHQARVGIYPFVAGAKVAGLIYAEPDSAGTSAIDLIATIAGAVLESHRASAKPEAVVLIAPAPTPAPPAPAEPEFIGGELAHLRAQRFARSWVSSVVLDRSAALDAARQRGDIYVSLKPHIDAGRQDYQRQFLNDASIHADYLHRELVRTLGKNNEALLGPEYPGPLE